MRAIAIIWYRDLLKYWRTKGRMISLLIMPFIWLVLFGSGISSSLGFQGGQAIAGFDYKLFLFPGVMGITVLFTAMFGAMSIVTDREFGFLKEVMVAPIPRAAMIIGSSLGSATVATIQGILMMIFLPLIDLSFKWQLIYVVPFLFIFAFMVSAIGVFAATRIKTAESFQMVMQFMTFPMFMLCGALFPLRNLPGWLDFLSKINPVTYGLDLIRKTIFIIFEVPDKVIEGFNISVWGYTITPFIDIVVLLYLGSILLIAATILFRHSEA